jgi:hypothetical protein
VNDEVSITLQYAVEETVGINQHVVLNKAGRDLLAIHRRRTVDVGHIRSRGDGNRDEEGEQRGARE